MHKQTAKVIIEVEEEGSHITVETNCKPSMIMELIGVLERTKASIIENFDKEEKKHDK